MKMNKEKMKMNNEKMFNVEIKMILTPHKILCFNQKIH